MAAQQIYIFKLISKHFEVDFKNTPNNLFASKSSIFSNNTILHLKTNLNLK
jgi:hypothetical protein